MDFYENSIIFAPGKLTCLTQRKTEMKSDFIVLGAVISGVLCWGSCTREVCNETGREDHMPRHELRVMTRTAEGDEIQGRVYLMSPTGLCQALLETDASGAYVSTQLPAGAYEVYAVGSDDLGNYALPVEEEAEAGSVISVASGKTMGDLLMRHDQVNLTDEATNTLDLELDRKVICLSEVTVRQVPADVTGVSITIDSLYAGVRLDGNYIGTERCQVVLEAAEDSLGLWRATPGLLRFPSKGNPKVTVAFVSEEGTKTYALGMEETFEPNHHVSLEGTYPQTDTIPAPAVPVAGELYKGCYVVTVDESQSKAVLLSPTANKGYRSAAAVNTALSNWPAVQGITGRWRLPTVEEVNIFGLDYELIGLAMSSEMLFYCQDGGQVSTISIRRYPTKYLIGSPTPAYIGYNTLLRPVLDLSW